MENDLISRKAVLELPRNVERTFFGEVISETVDVKAIEALPTIEPRVRSKWWHYEDILQCCNCSAEFYDDIVEYTGDDVPKFCPNCGADMREETE